MSLLAESGLPECQLLAKRTVHSVSEISELGIKYFLIDHLPTRNRYVFGNKKFSLKFRLILLREKTTISLIGVRCTLMIMRIAIFLKTS